MPNRIGSTKDVIDWQSVIRSIVPKSGDYNTPGAVVARSSSELDSKLDGNSTALKSSYNKIMSTWNDANYNFKHIEWYDYYPGEHFSIEVQNKFADLVGADPRRVFLVELYPGKCVPYHWDVEDKETEWLAQGDKLVRYVCFIDKPKFGHALILEDQCFYNVEEHEIYEWNSYKSYHAGTNAGNEAYYTFHFLGAQR